MIEGLPVLDAHLHLDPKGENRLAVRKFLDQGGTHLIIVHKPYHHIPVRNIEDYRMSFETTIRMTELARKEGAGAWCFVGPYPGELPKLATELGRREAVELQMDAVEEAFALVEEGRALGTGEVGRIHFDVEEEKQKACDEILYKVLRGARSLDCPVVLHTESYHSNPDLMDHISLIADRASFPREMVIKHYSGPDLIEPDRNLGISLSLQCRREALRILLGSEHDHLLETDYIDDPSRPNVVMPPETVPKKIQWAYRQGLIDQDRHARLMIDLPAKVLKIDIDR